MPALKKRELLRGWGGKCGKGLAALKNIGTSVLRPPKEINRNGLRSEPSLVQT